MALSVFVEHAGKAHLVEGLPGGDSCRSDQEGFVRFRCGRTASLAATTLIAAGGDHPGGCGACLEDETSECLGDLLA